MRTDYSAWEFIGSLFSTQQIAPNATELMILSSSVQAKTCADGIHRVETESTDPTTR